MNNLILVFTEEDKNKLVAQGVKYMGRQGNAYLLRNDNNVTFSNDIVSVRATNIVL